MKTSSIRAIHDDIAVVGWACRLPGANSIEELWSLLIEGRCAVTEVPPDRFDLDHFGHPRRQERGRSYTWAAGVLDDVWGFDPGVFGISPREAVQIDPQQRILLELTWEALEDAGIPPSSLSGSEVGVYVGASQTDYGHLFFNDPAIADAHFAPGTALAILANRISYIYGFHGPSLTLDTACSASLVALNEAVLALRSGRIDTAVVGASNLIASPASFIAFSQANMLSPTGRCRAFSDDADGFVRAEGAIVLVLRRVGHAEASQNPVHGLVVATDVNSDGRTNGISLPSLDAQEALLKRIYGRGGVDAEMLAFVEAHGTGTPVGDPVEATAIGRVIGRGRTQPIPIGSIKSNIGHLEPASGLAGVLKALLSLNHGLLPSSLHFQAPNPHIEFDALGLSVCTQPLLLPRAAEQVAGVNSFGFGGTNAHVVVAPGRRPEPAPAEDGDGSGLFTFSAMSDGALQALARDYRGRLGGCTDQKTAALASAIVHRRERHPVRLVVSSTRTGEVAEALDAFVAGRDHPRLTLGAAAGREMPVAFVFSGNGGQHVGMGLAAYRNNAAFRSRFEEIDAHFREIAGWSLREALFSETLGERLPLTTVAQPLIFAIQSASTAALREAGVEPSVVLGHSVGEVAAAEASGAVDLQTAIKVIHLRSAYQESRRGAGRMLAVLASVPDVQRLLDEVGGVGIAAVNSPRMVTVAGATDALGVFRRTAKKAGVATLDLGLDYPFHTALMDPIQEPLEADLQGIRTRDGGVPFISTVTGSSLPGARLNGTYWWRNVREPVQFTRAIRAATEQGARYFVEVGPRGTLVKHVTDTLRGEVSGFATYVPLEVAEADVDPFAQALAHAVATGARVATRKVFGPDPGPGTPLPSYPWQRTPFRFKRTVEAHDHDPGRGAHPFAGSRSRADSLDWRSHLDTLRRPELVDHRLGGQTIFPGTGFLEMALEVGRQWRGRDDVMLCRFAIVNPLDLSNEQTREVLTRVSPGSGTLEIYSRPRLSEAPWLLHCKCKVQSVDDVDVDGMPDAGDGGRILPPEALYEVAEASGLHYGPAFRLVRGVTLHGEDGIVVDLEPSTEATPFLLDPMRLDACAHGLFAVFPSLRAVERGITYIPVWVEEVSLLRAHVPPHRAVIRIRSTSERSIVADCHVLDARGEVVAVLRGIRSQAIPMRRSETLDSAAFVEAPHLVDGALAGETGLGEGAPGLILDGAGRLGVITEASGGATESEMLVEAWAMAAAYEMAGALAADGVVDVEGSVAAGFLPEEMRPWLLNLLANLATAGLAREDGEAWRLEQQPGLPGAAAVLRALATEEQRRSGEMLVAAAMADVPRRWARGEGVEGPRSVVPGSVLDFFHATSVMLREASAALHRLLEECSACWPAHRAVRVLQVGFAPLAEKLLAGDRPVRLSVFEPDPRRFAGAEVSLGRNPAVTLVGAEDIHELEAYDLVVGVAGLHRLPGSLGLDGLGRLLRPGGVLLALEPGPSLFTDLVCGLEPGWFGADATGRPVSPLRSPGRWGARLEGAGFAAPAVANVRFGSGSALLIVAGAPEVPVLADGDDAGASPGAQPTLSVVAPDGSELGEQLRDAFAVHGWEASLTDDGSGWPLTAPDAVVHLAASGDAGDPVATLTGRCLDIRDWAGRVGEAPSRLWLVFSGALDFESSPIDPVETGAWAFSRTLANELPNLDVRRIDLAPGLDREQAAAWVRRVVTSGTRETELHVSGQGVRAVRVRALRTHLDDGTPSRRAGARLERGAGGGQRVTWVPCDRRVPGPGEVEMEVEATGLNFRDVMWSLSLLPEDMIENGFSGPSLGLECAGRVVRVGPDVGEVAVGDRVMAFAASSFSTHVTLGRHQVVRLPDALSCEAAATIPVAFFTAYYGLVTQAGLKRREWVLVHGGAGAVGMAAIQIAKARGAKVIATAGTEAKRDLLRVLGADHVFDSRSTAFVEAVRRVTGDGVDVVLNSLAGEAMERSIACLRPFGRFVELGKRDYVADTHVGLRPFRRNLTYFGVDVDEVIGARPALGNRIFSRILAQFEKGAYVPLPYSVFEASDVTAAFHLMQQSGHVGKIVIRPPARGLALRAPKPAVIDPEGTHVITGAFGGFGMEVARWMVEKGARHLVMIGRRGAATEEARALVEEFTRRGVRVLAAPCDVSDRTAMERLFAEVRATMPPVVGAVHAAMVLDDGILSNLDAERFQRVLAPKVLGAVHLDRLLRGETLRYFVLFSSVTTLIGNPGQANYVAANAYMEGLARRRRQKGLPALAIGWGPITDVGVVARSERLQEGLQRLTGVTGMRAREALGLLEEALALPDAGSQAAVMTVTASGSSFGAERLAVLRSPTYEAFVRPGNFSEGEGERIDLQALAAREGVKAARRKAADVITAEVAGVLQLKEDDISPVRPLGEVGLDSLMALELVMKLEERFGLRMPLAGASGGVTINAIADQIIAHVGLDGDRGEAVAATMAEQHHGEVAEGELAALRDLVTEEVRSEKRLLS